MRIIKHITLFLLLLASSSTILAQVGDLKHILSLGFNAGTCYNKVSFTPTIKQQGLWNASAGATIRYISENYMGMICGIQAEVNYSQLGWKREYELEANVKDNSRGYTHHMNYLEIPFFAHLAFGQEYGFQGFLNIGPQIGFLINERESSFGITKEEMAQKRNEYGKKIENKFDYGIVGGAGIEVRTKKAGSFLVEGRYYFGLADFYKTTKKDYFSRAANSTISVKLTYLFDIINK